ncbi:hypothetical protein Tco_1176567 [Tanacetum coccineum]
MKNNQINLFTKSSTSANDLSEMDLKIKLLKNSLEQEALNAQDTEPPFHKRSQDNQDPPNDHEEEKRKKQRKDVGQSSSRSSRRNKSPVKSGSANTKRKMTWFDLLLKSDINQNENHILRPSTVDVAKKLKALIQKNELTIADLEEAKWNSNEDDVSKPRMFERHMSKNTKPRPTFYNNDFYYLVSLSTEEKYTTSITKHYIARYYQQDSRIDFFKVQMSNRSEGKVYSDLRIKSVVRIVVKKKWGYGFLTTIVVRRSDDNAYEFIYADLSRLSLYDVKDISGKNLIDMVTKNKLGKGNKRLKGRDWTDDDVVKSNEMVKKIDQTLKRKEHLIRVEEYVGGRPKTFNPCTFVKPM